MALTRDLDFKETVKARAARDPEFRLGLLQEALEAVLDADPKPEKCCCGTTGTRRSASSNWGRSCKAATEDGRGIRAGAAT